MHIKLYTLAGMTLYDINTQKCMLFFPGKYFNTEKYNIASVQAYISGVTSSIVQKPNIILGDYYIVVNTNIADSSYAGRYAILQVNVTPK